MIFDFRQDIRVPRLTFFATKDIPAGTELEYDYRLAVAGKSRLDNHEPNPIKCFCESRECRKTLIDRSWSFIRLPLDGSNETTEPTFALVIYDFWLGLLKKVRALLFINTENANIVDPTSPHLAKGPLIKTFKLQTLCNMITAFTVHYL